MNYLKECPQLFANGEFYIKSKETSEPDEIFILSGYARVISGKGWTDEVYFTKEGYNAVVESCTLIARPISDMTKEEYIEMFPHRAEASYNKDALIGLERRADMGKLMFSEVRYLLAFGIYIGQQEDFRDGIILDATKIEGL